MNALRAELIKLRSLPTPRWAAGAVLASLALGLLVSWIWGPGSDEAAIEISVGLPTWVASIVLGAWLAGVEYGQGTMRRVLTTDSRRIDLVAAKLAAVVVAAGSITVVASALAAPAFSLVASVHDESLPMYETLEIATAGLFNNLVYAVVGFALALLTRSMAGGMTVALAFAFVIDTALGAIPDVGEYTLGSAMVEIVEAISEATPREEPDLARALPVVGAWVAVLLGAAIARFVRSDVE